MLGHSQCTVQYAARRQLHSDPESDDFPPVFQVWGANTDVGKTAFCASLLSVVDYPSLYIKPVQSGYPNDDDSKKVQSVAPFARPITFHVYEDAVSPDLAAKISGGPPVPDDTILHSISAAINQFTQATIHSSETRTASRSTALVETAGGVLSPVPSGNLQADAYRRLRLPAILVGDRRLGGISTTLSAYEALRLRGYDVPAIVFFQEESGQLENEASVQRNVDSSATSIFQAPALPTDLNVPLKEYVGDVKVKEFFSQLLHHLRWSERFRLRSLDMMADEARRVFWYPFTQHAQLQHVKCFDSAHGDRIATYDSQSKKSADVVDAMGSWWTNGVGHGNVEVTKAIAHAAGRYGHVMFAKAVNSPALHLAKRMLSGPGKDWATRVFYSDNGSTAIEVGLKMALRKRAKDVPERAHLPSMIVALTNSYHGDTLGAMDCSEESDFNRTQTPWYQSRGMFLSPPTVDLRDGVWTITRPQWLCNSASKQTPHDDQEQSEDPDQSGTEHKTLRLRNDIFDIKARINDEVHYARIIGDVIAKALESDEYDLGALVMEPVLQGAGGMQMIDPMFQRALALECRKRKIPIVLDEIFTGLWRLGSVSAARGYLGIEPDIAAYGKLLTGGTVPLSVTLATEDVLHAFDGDSKMQALLHGHSYTAHPIGCAAGVQSLRMYDEAFGKHDPVTNDRVYWNEGSARELSGFQNVKRVTVLGTLLAVEVHSVTSGYAATGANYIVQKLGQQNVYTRPLGNVVYLMCTPLTDEETCRDLMNKLFRVLEHMNDEQSPEDEEVAK